MAQAVTITEDGEIGLQASVVDGPDAVQTNPRDIAIKRKIVSRQFIENSFLTHLTLSPMINTTAKFLNYDYRFVHTLVEKHKLKDMYI